MNITDQLISLGVMVIIFPFVCFGNSIIQRFKGRYLNNYFVVKYLGGNEYELFLQPTWGYYHASERKFYRKLVEAVTVFEQGYPDARLIAQSLMFTSIRRESQVVPVNRFLRFGYLLSTDLTILLNLANYRDFKFIRLMKKSHRSEVLKHIIL